MLFSLTGRKIITLLKLLNLHCELKEGRSKDIELSVKEDSIARGDRVREAWSLFVAPAAATETPSSMMIASPLKKKKVPQYGIRALKKKQELNIVSFALSDDYILIVP